MYVREIMEIVLNLNDFCNRQSFLYLLFMFFFFVCLTYTYIFYLCVCVITWKEQHVYVHTCIHTYLAGIEAIAMAVTV